MKKILRKTGEIVDVISYSNFYHSERDKMDSVSYIDSKGIEHHNERGLNLWWDFEDMEDVPNTDIDWEKVRIKAAISALQGFAASPQIASTDTLAKWSICAADTLIAELKKGGEK